MKVGLRAPVKNRWPTQKKTLIKFLGLVLGDYVCPALLPLWFAFLWEVSTISEATTIEKVMNYI